MKTKYTLPKQRELCLSLQSVPIQSINIDMCGYGGLLEREYIFSNIFHIVAKVCMQLLTHTRRNICPSISCHCILRI